MQSVQGPTLDRPIAAPGSKWLTHYLSRAPAPVFIAYAVGAAFGVYFCMYAFRKPFDVVEFKGQHFLGSAIELKTACVLGQIIGYMLSKYLGTKICTEARSRNRALLLIALIMVAEFGLLLFAVAPTELKPAAMLLNGLPLGMVWGLVVRYLEGRRSSELLVAGLSCSYIIAGAATRDIGKGLIAATGIREVWMPFLTGALFIVPLLVMVWLLDQLPPPNQTDEALRAPRLRMGGRQRWAFLVHFGWGLALLLVPFFFLTAFRDFRDHYSPELFDSLGLGNEKAIFSKTEQWAMFASIAVMAGLNLITNNRRALLAAYGVIMTGYAIIGAATWFYIEGALTGYAWMAMLGVGLYLAYIPYGAVLFERMMAASRFAGTAVFAIQLADAVGYTGSVLVQLYRDIFHGQADRLEFIVPFAYVVSLTGVVLMAASSLLTVRLIRRVKAAPASIEA